MWGKRDMKQDNEEIKETGKTFNLTTNNLPPPP